MTAPGHHRRRLQDHAARGQWIRAPSPSRAGVVSAEVQPAGLPRGKIYEKEPWGSGAWVPAPGCCFLPVPPSRGHDSPICPMTGLDAFPGFLTRLTATGPGNTVGTQITTSP